MNNAMMSDIFAEDPILLGIVEVDGIEHRQILTGVSLGAIQRFSGKTSAMQVNRLPDDSDMDYMHRMFSEVLKAAPYIIVESCNRKPMEPTAGIITALMQQWSPQQIANALQEIIKRIDVDALMEFYKFENKSGKKYPGSGSPWAMIINTAIASKGWSEYDLKWNISFANLLLYSQCIPSYDSDGKTQQQEPGDMFDFFDSLGK